MNPSRGEAEALLAWGGKQNPGPWLDHCKNAARAAQAIAEQCGMDPERAYVSGLLHDIGYYANADGTGKNCHVYNGYALMMEKGCDAVAKICITHSFNIQDIRVYTGSNLTKDENELAVIRNCLIETVYDDYDRLIQLCDAICTADGVCTVERRLTEIILRQSHRAFNEYTIEKWKAYFALKGYFDEKCGMNIYNLFREEISKGIFN
ncbi:MAG: HDIG domain-containing protein [Defluviitaleaceae bacterium]|nr:HDIG domain-containing protein [Defluviitaleaceae bacterium]